ncbi:unnamed protein product [Spirodela intermedia]|uniref:Uncharacterized protein n=1 Tax=Spirodela intermedia TaxID=51605 RepID=A0A7I8LCL4_SPIIN|nr:unnamed protein product [Spirodela intermedia]
MKKKAAGSGGGGGRACDACQSAAAAVYCRADSAYLCGGCDARVHAANWVASRHDRVSLCDAAALTCKEEKEDDDDDDEVDDGEEDEVSSWLLLNSGKNSGQGLLFASEDNDYLDFAGYGSSGDTQQTQGGDGKKLDGREEQVLLQQQQLSFPLEMAAAYEASNGFYGYTAFFGHVDQPAMEARTVPDVAAGGAAHFRQPKGTIDLFAGATAPPAATSLSAGDREARVLRYREKRKTRRFEKTIRYASRKAYAETRPRVKGRFAKRSDAELEVDQLFSTAVMAETGYGVVPSF